MEKEQVRATGAELFVEMVLAELRESAHDPERVVGLREVLALERVRALAQRLAMVKWSELQSSPGGSRDLLHNQGARLGAALEEEVLEAAREGRPWVPWDLVTLVGAQEASRRDPPAQHSEPDLRIRADEG